MNMRHTIDGDEEPKYILDMNDAVDLTGRLINYQPAYDQIINCKASFSLLLSIINIFDF